MQLWDMMDDDELEMVVCRYIESLGYTLDESSFERKDGVTAVRLVAADGVYTCLLHITRDVHMIPIDYYFTVKPKENEWLCLFNAKEDYGEKHKRVECLGREEVFNYMKDNRDKMPVSLLDIL